MKKETVIIDTIDDILPALKDKPEFVVSDKGAYKVIDYVYSTPDSFNDARLLECRGIKFHPDGKIMARPFHKFFNLGQVQQPEDIDWKQPHIVYEKLDGSMIHPVVIKNKFYLMTRMGITDVAKQATECVTESFMRFCLTVMNSNMTPIFEYTSPRNRIVVRYDKPQLTLLAIRHNRTGSYMTLGEMRIFAKHNEVPVVHSIASNLIEPLELVSRIKHTVDGREGVVIAFSDGHRIKVKSDDYVKKHLCKSYFDNEKHVLKLVLEDKVDDLLPLIDEKDHDRLVTYYKKVWASVVALAARIRVIVDKNKHLSRKEVATQAFLNLDPRIRHLAFKVLDGENEEKAVINYMLTNCGSSGRIDTIRNLIDVTW